MNDKRIDLIVIICDTDTSPRLITAL
jgi:hypothetical protein